MGCTTETPPQGGGRFCSYYGEERPVGLSAKECGKPHCPAYGAGPNPVHRKKSRARRTFFARIAREAWPSAVPRRDGRGARRWRAPLEPSPGGQSSNESLLGRWTPRDSRELPKSDRTYTRCRPTENAPPGRRGASGVTTGRRDMYLCICGSMGGRWALNASRGLIEGVDGHRMGGARPNREDRLKQTFHRSSSAESLNQNTNICAVYV